MATKQKSKQKGLVVGKYYIETQANKNSYGTFESGYPQKTLLGFEEKDQYIYRAKQLKKARKRLTTFLGRWNGKEFENVPL